MTRRPLRCAIYTRKSSEEGLDQSFNSLHAQREACEAYIKSQAHEGWRPIATAYDDGGFSGGSMDRPALQKLLQDIHDKKIDVIVVYKVDRLTRSLADFAKMVEILDRHGVSFVSVTQQFNTTSSMGRLTLNVLLSFAQFEREVTGERIRDKFAASRKKGMWMGGNIPLGYDLKDRKLLVNRREAKTVRHIYERYLALGTVARLIADLARDDIRSKAWVNSHGKRTGGTPFTRGPLYKILKNRLYIGEAVHKDKAYPGQHAAIIAPDLWQRVQDRLRQDSNRRGRPLQKSTSALLAGLLHDDRGNRMSPAHATKNGKKYRYYVSQALLQHRKDDAGSVTRVPAQAIEDLVRREVTGLLSVRQRRVWDGLSQADQDGWLRRNVCRIEVDSDKVVAHLQTAAGGAMKTNNAAETDPIGPMTCSSPLVIPARIRTWGGARLIVTPASEGRAQPSPNITLIKAIARAWAWREAMLGRHQLTVADIAAGTGFTKRYVRHLLQLAFLAPDLIATIVEGRQPAGLKITKVQSIGLPPSWNSQRDILLGT